MFGPYFSSWPQRADTLLFRFPKNFTERLFRRKPHGDISGGEFPRGLRSRSRPKAVLCLEGVGEPEPGRPLPPLREAKGGGRLNKSFNMFGEGVGLMATAS